MSESAAIGPEPIRSFDYAVLLCRKMADTTAFYRDVLRFRLETDRENWVSFRVGVTLLTLRPRGVSPLCADGAIEPGAVALQLAFRVSPPAIEAWHAELTARGVSILRGPTDLPQWRHRTLFFRDPEDNILELYAEY